MTRLFVFALITILASCQEPPSLMKKDIDIQGHRGCRGLLPENTIIGFKKAVDLGVNTLELDLCINGDKEPIVSHEPFFNHEISIGPDSLEITEEIEKQHNVYRMTQEKIESYDVGLKAHPRFERQKKVAATKPTLRQMVTEIESYAKAQKKNPPLYNMEIKRLPIGDNSYHPDMATFADIVVQTIDSLGVMDRTTVQCFDVETLQYINKTYPNTTLVYLVGEEISFEKAMDKLGFVPEVYSPYYQLVTPELVEYCGRKKMKLIPWTVNEADDVEQLLKMGVDGIISDYPDMAIEIHQSLQPK